MSNTTTPSDEDKLYLTEDLEGRLDPASLEAPKDLNPSGPESDIYKPSFDLVFPAPDLDLPSPPKVTLAIVFGEGEAYTIESSLQSLSFGPEGWLCAVSVEDSSCVLPIVMRAAKDPVGCAMVSLAGETFSMFTNVDCTISFSYGSASFTVTSDEARYV